MLRPAFVAGAVTITPIHTIQGSGSTVSVPGTEVTIQGVVTGDFQASNELKGFFMQEEDTEADANSSTSEGIFVYCNSCAVDVTEGQIVQVTGEQNESFGMSQLDVPAATNGLVVIVDAGDNSGLVTPSSVDLPAPTGTDQEGTFEHIEGMLVQFIDTLSVSEYFQLERYGQVFLSEGERSRIFTENNPPDPTNYDAHRIALEKRRIILDDGSDRQNSADPVFHPQPGGFSTSNYFRGGDTVTNLRGIMHWSFPGSGSSRWRIRPQKSNPVSFTADNPRPMTPPDVGGDLQIASVNTLNFFSSIDDGNNDCGPAANQPCRGADSAAELTRQTDKLIAALAAINADIVGLLEIENNASASLQAIVDALNTHLGANSYGFIDSGTLGNDAIKNGFIYKTTVVAPAGTHAVLDSTSFVDPNNTGADRNRPALAQTFKVIEAGNPSQGEKFTAVVLHLKSKGQGCIGTAPDNDTAGQGNCNLTRSLATAAMMDWLATDPTASGDEDFLILGDLNTYAMEDPITNIRSGADGTIATADDFVDLLAELGDSKAYSYVFYGELGSLQRFLANTQLASGVTGVSAWHVNADEVNLFDYNDAVQDATEPSFQVKPSVNTLYSADAFRFSDHDPLLLGLNLTSPPLCFPIHTIKGSVALICL